MGRPTDFGSSASRSRDLIGDIHAKERAARVRKIVVAVVVLVAIAGAVIGVMHMLDRADRAKVLEKARADVAGGTAADLQTTIEGLEKGLEQHPDDPEILGSRALARVMLFAEFGQGGEEARAAVGALGSEASHDGLLARGILALSDGEYAAAQQALDETRAHDDEESIAAHHEVWLEGMLAVAHDRAAIPDATAALESSLAEHPSVPGWRLLALLRMYGGDHDAALEELSRARERSPSHMALAADEALYNAMLRRKLGGVADVADQLEDVELGTIDRAHTRLARAVVHVHSGELEDGMELMDEAWADLPQWDTLSRQLALEEVMGAADAERAKAWMNDAGLDDDDKAIYRAWITLVEGDVMDALSQLAELPQEHPRVALLQGLALVEQTRWVEAGPWLERADKLMPGRVDVEVARARVEAHVGDAESALRKLEALAEEEPYAPRAWTGVGEARMAVATAAKKNKTKLMKKARKAFERAVEQELLPAEALLRLSEVHDERRKKDKAEATKILELLRKAVKTNPNLPRYEERLARFLAFFGQEDEAFEMLTGLIEKDGIEAETVLVLIDLGLERAKKEPPKDLEDWLEKAEKLGVPAAQIELLKARGLMITEDRKKLDEPAAMLDKLISADDSNVEARLLRADIHLEKFAREEAVRVLRRGMQAAPNDDGRLYFAWSRIEQRFGQDRSATFHSHSAWKKMTAEDRPVRELFAVAAFAIKLQTKAKKDKIALKIGRELTEYVPYHSESWRIRAGIQLKVGSTAEAKASATKALEIDPDNPQAHEILGHVHQRFGQKDEAKKAYGKAIELAKGTPLEKSMRERLRGKR